MRTPIKPSAPHLNRLRLAGPRLFCIALAATGMLLGHSGCDDDPGPGAATPPRRPGRLVEGKSPAPTALATDSPTSASSAAAEPTCTVSYPPAPVAVPATIPPAPYPAHTTEHADQLVGATANITGTLADIDVVDDEPTATATQSLAKWGIVGTDLGYSFDLTNPSGVSTGKTVFLFGDTLCDRCAGAFDSVAYSSDPPPTTASPFKLTFFDEYSRPSSTRKRYMRFRIQENIPGTTVEHFAQLGAFEMAASGISLDGKHYLVLKREDRKHSPAGGGHDPCDRWYSELVSWDGETGLLKPIRRISQPPAERFVKMSLREGREPAPPSLVAADARFAGAKLVWMWGTGWYRRSSVHLAVVTKASFGERGSALSHTGAVTAYFSGYGPNDQATWSLDESDAKALFEASSLGDISVSHVPNGGAAAFVMVYDRREDDQTEGGSNKKRNVYARFASRPWGPWSEEQKILDLGGSVGQDLVYRAGRAEKLRGPTFDEDITKGGTLYAPYVIERLTQLASGTLTIHYVVSTWNPYFVHLMKTTFSPAN